MDLDTNRGNKNLMNQTYTVVTGGIAMEGEIKNIMGKGKIK
jgi:hypothetical protein